MTAIEKTAARVLRMSEEATPGPWYRHPDVPNAIVTPHQPHESLLALDIDGMAIIDVDADAVFIAAARTAAPALARYVAAVAPLVERLRAARRINDPAKCDAEEADVVTAILARTAATW
jgi:hypothetical protein